MAVDESSGEVVGWVCWEVVDAGRGGGGEIGKGRGGWGKRVRGRKGDGRKGRGRGDWGKEHGIVRMRRGF